MYATPEISGCSLRARLGQALVYLEMPRRQPIPLWTIRQTFTLGMMRLPTRQEINPFGDLDGRDACEHFFGKDLEEAEALFRENDLYYQGDLLWMGPSAFRFYLPAVFRFVHRSTDDISEFVSHFSNTLAFRLKHEADELTPVASQLAEFCSYVIGHWSKFSDGAAAYGDVRARYERLRIAFSGMCDKAE